MWDPPVESCAPWATATPPSPSAAATFRSSPLLFRPKLDPYQWRWGAKYLTHCNDASFARNVRQLVALGAYSHASLKGLVARRSCNR